MNLTGYSLSMQSYWLPMPADGVTCYGCKLAINGDGHALFIQATPPDVSQLSIHDAQTVLCDICKRLTLVYHD